MKSFGWGAAARAAAVWIAITSFTNGLRPALAQDAQGVVEIVPTGRRERVIWRYTFERPGDRWSARSFDDRQWKSGAAGFGTAGTPGVVVNTNWATRDIWLRREVTLPARGFDLSSLQLLVFHDEDVEVYFDGVLAAREAGFLRDYEPLEIRPEA